jgi:hypothetical protein
LPKGDGKPFPFLVFSVHGLALDIDEPMNSFIGEELRATPGAPHGAGAKGFGETRPAFEGQKVSYFRGLPTFEAKTL